MALGFSLSMSRRLLGAAVRQAFYNAHSISDFGFRIANFPPAQPPGCRMPDVGCQMPANRVVMVVWTDLESGIRHLDEQR